MKMAFQILLNALIAIVWMFLSTSFTPQTFVIGYLIGILILLIMRRYFKERFYLGWIWAAIKLILIFLRELVMSNITVLRIVLDPKMDIKPGVFAFPTELESDWEIDRKSTRLNSSHVAISYADFCLKKKMVQQ